MQNSVTYPKKSVISVSEASTQKSCSSSTIYRWIHQGKIDAIKAQGRWSILCNWKWELVHKRQKKNLSTSRKKSENWKNKYEALERAHQKQCKEMLEAWEEIEKGHLEKIEALERAHQKQCKEMLEAWEEIEKGHLEKIEILKNTNQELANAIERNCFEIRYLQSLLLRFVSGITFLLKLSCYK